MSRRVAVAATVAGVAVFVVLVLVAKRGLPVAERRVAAKPVSPPAAATPAAPGRKIKARLFYVADDGVRLTSVERDVAYGEGTEAQAREIVAAQIAPVSPPTVSAVPNGTTLRAVFITKAGD